MMDWDNVRVFLAVARGGQFVAAAKRLRLDHATVSRRIAALEGALGAKLFDRRTTGAKLTGAGERFIGAAEQMESAFLHAQGEISGVDLELTGDVRIGAPDGFSTYYLTGALRDFAERHPGVRLQLMPLPQLTPLARREVDVVVGLDKPEAGRFIARKLTDYTLGIYASAAYLKHNGAPADVGALKAHRLIGYVEEHAFSTALDYVRELYDGAPTSFESASAVTQLEALRAGVGIGVVHDFIARRFKDLHARAARTPRHASLLARHPRRHARSWAHPRRRRASGESGRARSGDVFVRRAPVPAVRSGSPLASHRIELVVRPDGEGVGEPVGHREQGGDCGDVPGVFVRKAMTFQRSVILFLDVVRALGDLDGEVEHRLLPRRQVGLAMIDGDLVGDERILGADAQDRAMGDDAILAVVEAGRGDYDHLTLGFAQVPRLFHQRVMIGEEGAELVRPARQREKDIGDESGLLLNRGDPLADVLGKFGNLGHGKSTDRRLGVRLHKLLLACLWPVQACRLHLRGCCALRPRGHIEYRARLRSFRRRRCFLFCFFCPLRRFDGAVHCIPPLFTPC